MERLLASLIVLISTLLTKYSCSNISNLLSPSPGIYFTFSPVINPCSGIVISVLLVKLPEKLILDSRISKESFK